MHNNLVPLNSTLHSAVYSSIPGLRLLTLIIQRTESGWREVLVDIDPAKGSEGGREIDKALRFVLAPGPTPASVAYTSLLPQEGYQVRPGKLHYIIITSLVMICLGRAMSRGSVGCEGTSFPGEGTWRGCLGGGLWRDRRQEAHPESESFP